MGSSASKAVVAQKDNSRNNIGENLLNCSKEDINKITFEGTSCIPDTNQNKKEVESVDENDSRASGSRVGTSDEDFQKNLENTEWEIEPLSEYFRNDEILGISSIAFEKQKESNLADKHAHEVTEDSEVEILNAGHVFDSSIRTETMTDNNCSETDENPKKKVPLFDYVVDISARPERIKYTEKSKTSDIITMKTNDNKHRNDNDIDSDGRDGVETFVKINEDICSKEISTETTITEDSADGNAIIEPQTGSKVTVQKEIKSKLSKSSSMCLDTIDSKWEAFFMKNVSRDSEVEQCFSFEPASYNRHKSFPFLGEMESTTFITSFPPSSTTYQSRNKQKLTKYQIEEAGIDKNKSVKSVETCVRKENSNKVTNSQTGNKIKHGFDRNLQSETENCNTLENSRASESSEDFTKQCGNTNYKSRDYNFDLALNYLEALQNTVRQLGYFDQFPTSEVIEKAQDTLRKSKIVPPRNESGISIPYPYLLSDKENKNVSDVDGIVSERLASLEEKSTSALSQILQDTSARLNNDIQKIRAIYKLIVPCFEDWWRRLDKNKVFNRDGEEAVLNEKFASLCGEKGLHCAIISGNRKDGDGTSSQGTSWTSVLLDGKWRLIDPQLPFLFSLENSIFHEETLAKSQLKIHYASVYNMLYEFYFFVKPSHLIQMNLPYDVYWQLLCRTVHDLEWEQMAYVTPFFFIYNLQLVNILSRRLQVDNQNTKIDLMFPKDKDIIVMVTLTDAESKNLLKGFTFVENDLENRLVHIHCKAPKRGSYILQIYCRDISIPFYIRVCCIPIEFKFESLLKCVLFPTGLRQQWGPGYDTECIGLIALSHTNAIIEVKSETELIRFKQKFGQTFYCHLFNQHGDSFEKNILYWIEDSIVNIIVTSPGEGINTFGIFCSDCKVLNSGIPVCSYVLDFKTSSSNRFKNLEIPSRKLGLTDSGRRFKCEILSQQSSFTHASECGILELRFKTLNSVVCFPRLKFNGTYASLDMNEHVAWFRNDGYLSCTINLPRQGDFLFQLCSKIENGASVLYSAVIHVQVPSANWVPFPKMLTQNTDITVRILEPHSGILPAKTDVDFKVELMCDCDVAIVTSRGWFHLDQTQENHWEGNITTGGNGTEVRLVARFEIGSDVFTPLLVYKVATQEEIQKKSLHQHKLREDALKHYIDHTVKEGTEKEHTTQ